MLGGGTLTLSRYWSVTLIGSPSFSHRCATSVRTWLSSMTPEATPRKMRKAASGMVPVATSTTSAIAQSAGGAFLPAPLPREVALGALAAELGVDLQARIAPDDQFAQLRRKQRQGRQHGEAEDQRNRRQRRGDDEHRQRPRLHQRERQIFGILDGAVADLGVMKVVDALIEEGRAPAGECRSAAFHSRLNPGSAPCLIWVSSWMKLPARNSARIATTPAMIASGQRRTSIAVANAP